jgi:hypothetical protein
MNGLMQRSNGTLFDHLVCGEFVIPGGDAPALLDPVEEADMLGYVTSDANDPKHTRTSS